MSLGANFWLPPSLLLAMCFALVVYWLYTMKDLRFQWKDLRFLILPSVVLGIGFLTHYHLTPAFYDQAYHLQISNRILDRWDWEPTHQGMSYSFRPELLSGIAAVELWMTGETSSVLVVPALHSNRSSLVHSTSRRAFQRLEVWIHRRCSILYISHRGHLW